MGNIARIGTARKCLSEPEEKKDAGELILLMRINNKTDLKCIGYGEVVLNSCSSARWACEHRNKILKQLEDNELLQKGFAL